MFFSEIAVYKNHTLCAGSQLKGLLKSALLETYIVHDGDKT